MGSPHPRQTVSVFKTSSATGRLEGPWPNGDRPGIFAGPTQQSQQSSAALAAGSLPLIYSTNFDAMTLNAAPSGDLWSGNATGPNVGSSNSWVKVSNVRSSSGTQSLNFHFGANDFQPNAEYDFRLPANWAHIIFQYDLYIPTNYVHPPTSVGAGRNNKFFRIGTDSVLGTPPAASGTERFGMSLEASTSGLGTGISNLDLEWTTSNVSAGAIDPHSSSIVDFISTSDLGQWMTIAFEMKWPQNSSDTAVFKFWKNGTLKMDCATPLLSFPIYDPVSAAPTPHKCLFGYFFGSTNARYTVDTDFYIDNFSYSAA